MNNTDPTSFQSILAGVKRLREQNGSSNDGGDHKQESQKPSSKIVRDHIRSENTEVINAFNQERLGKQLPENDNAPNRLPQTLNPGKTVLVNTTQKENPLLNQLKNTNWRYISSTKGTKIYYDYLVKKRSILFLTLTYHKLYADYIARRVLPLERNGDNILIFIVDDSNSEDILTDITKLCMFKGFTLLVAFNFEQAAKYIEYLNR